MEDWKALMKSDDDEDLLSIPPDPPPTAAEQEEDDPSSQLPVRPGSFKRSSLRKSTSFHLLSNEEDELELNQEDILPLALSASEETLVLPNPRPSKKVSIDMSTMLNQMKDDEDPPPDQEHKRGSKPPPENSYQGPPHLSIANLSAAENFREKDAALKQANAIVPHTLLEKDCTAIDVIRVWEEISKFILMKLMEGRSVRIAGLGSFTYKTHRTPVNQKSFKIIKYPMFILAQHLITSYGLVQERRNHTNVIFTFKKLKISIYIHMKYKACVISRLSKFH